MSETPTAGDGTPHDDHAAAAEIPTTGTPPPVTSPQGDPVPEGAPPDWGAAPRRKKKGKGCLIALVVVLALIVGGGWFGWMFVRDKAEEAGVSLDRGPAGLIPGLDDDCLRFQASLMFTSMSGIMTMGSDDLQGQLDEMHDLAPEAVRDDVQVFADALSEAMAEGLVGATTGGAQSPEAQAANEARVEEILESPEVQQATANMERWAVDNCDADPNDPSGFSP